MTFARYVAIGDSSTEGLDDPDGRGGYRGWANRLAEHVARVQGSLHYANLGVRGLRTRQILERQLEPALAMQPDLVTVFSGTNDVVQRGFDADAVAQAMERMQRPLVDSGARVLTFTLPDLSEIMPVAHFVASRVRALNDALRQVAANTGATLVDVAAHPVACDPRLWSDDRLHANSHGHERIAAALAHALGLPDTDESWAAPLPPLSPPTARQRLAAELRWGRHYFLPWIWRHMRGRSSGDGRTAKQPTLTPLSSRTNASDRGTCS